MGAGRSHRTQTEPAEQRKFTTCEVSAAHVSVCARAVLHTVNTKRDVVWRKNMWNCNKNNGPALHNEMQYETRCGLVTSNVGKGHQEMHCTLTEHAQHAALKVQPNFDNRESGNGMQQSEHC